MKLQFETNVPREVCLESLDGEPKESQYGGPQRMYTTLDRDVFYVSDAVGKIIADTCRKLKIDAGEPVVICKAEVSDGRGRKTIRWQVTRVNPIGQQADGTFAVPAVANTNGANGSQTPAPPVTPATQVQQQPVPSPIGNGIANGGNGHSLPPANPLVHTGWALHLREQAQTLIDIYNDCLTYSGKYGAAVKPDDVRSIVLSCFINVTKSNGGGR
jgi:hypothetical protein